MSLNTSKFALPLIAANQAQKEVTHNEAVVGLETLAQLAVVSRSLSVPPEAPQDGEAWVVGAGATLEWQGQDHNIALWVSGWRFYPAREGLEAWVLDEEVKLRYSNAMWQIAASTTQGIITDPMGGNVVDLSLIHI